MLERIKNKFLKTYLTSDFKPGVMGLFFNHFYWVRSNLYRTIKENSGYVSGKVLDIGCGSKPYKELFAWDTYIGLEYSTAKNRIGCNADLYYNGKCFPCEDKSFDSAVCFQVLEHVFNPDEFLYEISRTLKTGGKLMLTVPFVWPLHEEPYDCARYSPFGLKSMLEKNGFEIKTQKRLSGDSGIGLVLVLSKLFNTTTKYGLKTKLFLALFTVFPINLLLWFLLKKDVSNSDIYFDNFIIAEKK